ncbi:hypothetical protein E2C01_102302 [Portunus trituberculatus]|uniref:Uncharacterized protein n=1 Tax=Portunus trituberculatus TaxID=210409 RepID=A0A5B7KM92_PORTR|nr:hypothetical protein [Portunus trituberculatus]
MGKITTSFIPHWSYTHVQDRTAQTLLARLRIGHTYLTQRFVLTRDPQPYCDDCLVPLTVRHLLVECLSLIELRHAISTATAVEIAVSINYLRSLDQRVWPLAMMYSVFWERLAFSLISEF